MPDTEGNDVGTFDSSGAFVSTKVQHLHWQWGAVKNETLRQKRWFQFSHCELSIIICKKNLKLFKNMLTKFDDVIIFAM
jgi:hypothetical protein